MPRAYPFLTRMHLKRRGDFERVYRQGSRARGSLMTVCVASNGLDDRRLGLSIGRKVWRSAVRRNRVRRIFRESFRLSYPELPPGVDVILIGSRPKIEPQLGATCEELVYLAKKAYRRHLERQATLALEAEARVAAERAP